MCRDKPELRSPVFDRPVRNPDFGCRTRVAARAVANADFFDNLLELANALKPSQAIFEVFGNSQPRARPGGEFAEHPARLKLAVLFDHQVEVTGEEADLSGGSGFNVVDCGK